MTTIAEMITEETKRMIEQTGREYKPTKFEEKQATPELTEQDKATLNSQIVTGTEMKLKEQESYRKMFGSDPKGETPISWSESY
ncbi:MAG TPA: hypothetical protein VHO50_07135 [Bacteroidales bacterium]|nr:hypothetical protein [Bacteroidales bacterium]